MLVGIESEREEPTEQKKKLSIRTKGHLDHIIIKISCDVT